ncbi:lactadherin [Biomphalaria glabrata]|nr:lactadherin [Biomphalaria glabrata]
MRYPNDLMRYPNDLMRYPNDLMRYPNNLMRYSNDLMRYPNDLMRYPNELMRNSNDLISIENLAYKKDSWINKKLNKRHIREGHAERAVDGDLDLRLQSCTILDNLYGKYPLWTVDLGQKTTVSGVVIYTWQGDGPARSVSFRDYMRNLDQLVVYVDDKIQKKEDEHDESYASGNMCNYISSINNALFSKRLVLQCVGNLVGRYVLIEAWGRQIGWSRLFGAVLCEVQVFN